jgi:hypothetical protein
LEPLKTIPDDSEYPPIIKDHLAPGISVRYMFDHGPPLLQTLVGNIGSNQGKRDLMFVGEIHNLINFLRRRNQSLTKFITKVNSAQGSSVIF